MKINKSTAKSANRGSRGFSLVELMIVVAILGILAVAVGVNINSANSRLKSFVFNTKARFNQTRFEAVKRSRDVYLEFHLNMDETGYSSTAAPDNGFTIWVDENGDGNYTSWDIGTDDDNSNGECDAGEGDCVLSVVTFPADGPEIYRPTITGGPGTDGPGSITISSDGVTAPSNRFMFRPDGDCPNNGSVYFYYPSGGKVASGPWAIIVNTVGRIRVDEWRSTNGWQGDLP